MEQYAVASTHEDRYHGTKVTINLWQPMIARTRDFSLTQLWINGGSYSSNDLNTIEVGWQVRHQRETFKHTVKKRSYKLFLSAFRA
jgi:hypothetical protein